MLAWRLPSNWAQNNRWLSWRHLLTWHNIIFIKTICLWHRKRNSLLIEATIYNLGWISTGSTNAVQLAPSSVSIKTEHYSMFSRGRLPVSWICILSNYLVIMLETLNLCIARLVLSVLAVTWRKKLWVINISRLVPPFLFRVRSVWSATWTASLIHHMLLLVQMSVANLNEIALSWESNLMGNMPS